jgi:hypothetical protein
MAGEEALILLFSSLAAVAAVLVAGFGKGWFATGRSNAARVPTAPTPADPVTEGTAGSPEVIAEAEAQTAQAYAALERVADALQAQAAEIDAASHDGGGAIAIISAPTDLVQAPQPEITEVTTAFEPPVTVYDPPFPAPVAESATTTADEGIGMAAPAPDAEVSVAISPAMAVTTAPTKRARRSTTSRTRRTRSKRTP